MNNKDTTNKNDKFSVYELQCADCDSIYVGQIGHNFGTKIKEHKK